MDGHGPDENVQYRIGSITKTFTAVLVLRLRDEGLLDLGDPLEKHLPGTGAGEATIAELLAPHRRVGGRGARALVGADPGLAASRARRRPGRAAASCIPSGRRFHYSNPGYTLLGALVEKLRGAPWEEVLRREVLEPLGLRPHERAAAGAARGRLGGASLGRCDAARARRGPRPDGSGRATLVDDR